MTTETDATRLAAAIGKGALSPVEAVDDALTKIAQLDDHLNACSVVMADEARAAAARAEEALRQGSSVGPLHGVPVAVKDAIWIAGQRATLGTAALKDFVPAEDATVVKRLRAAGAIVVAKTTNPEYLWSGYTRSELLGVTRNPWSPDRTPGGSSGGSGAALAAGMVPLALGSDAGGSIRIPASFCGVVGLKPSRGVVPRYPGFHFCDTTTVVGPMARSARDLRTALSVIAGLDAADNGTVLAPDYSRRELPKDTRIAYSSDLGFADVDARVRTAFERALEQLEDAGWRFNDAAPKAADPQHFALPLYLGELGPPPGGRLELMQPELQEVFTEAASLSARNLWAAYEARLGYARVWEEFFDDFDLLVTPSVAIAPFDAEAGSAIAINGVRSHPDEAWWIALSVPVNMTGQPAVSVPLGQLGDGMPFGVQIVGPRFGDGLCLAAAEAIESILPWPVTAPLARPRA